MFHPDILLDLHRIEHGERIAKAERYRNGRAARTPRTPWWRRLMLRSRSVNQNANPAPNSSAAMIAAPGAR
jgi:hypothetical protein